MKEKDTHCSSPSESRRLHDGQRQSVFIRVERALTNAFAEQIGRHLVWHIF